MKNSLLKRLPDSELEIMKVLWAAPEGLTRPEMENRLTAKEWTATTVLALITRLESKGFLRREKAGKGYLYFPAVSENDYLRVESQSALGRMFGGSAKNLVAALHDTETLSKDDIEELAEYLKQLQERR